MSSSLLRLQQAAGLVRDWVAPGDAPPRATVQARLAKPDWKIELVVTASL